MELRSARLNSRHYLTLLVLAFAISSCSTGKTLSTNYYYEHKDKLDNIRDRFSVCYAKKPFSIEFSDKKFRYISYEILSDTMRHIYSFDLEESNLADTLEKYKYDSKEIIKLISDMRSIQCTWVSQLSYYEKRVKKDLIFISVRNNKLESLLNGEKYYALAFFNERQYFDSRGRLRDRTEKKRLKEINGEIYRKITDQICYAITGNFR